MKKILNYEAPCSEELSVNLEKRFLTESEEYNPYNDRGTAAPPQGYNGGSYGEF